MLSLRIGIWENDPGKSSGSFKVFGKKFVVFVDRNPVKNANGPHFWVTIKEHEDRKT